MSYISLGADPEYFIVKNGLAQVAEDFWEGSEYDQQMGRYERDGLVVEIKTDSPTSCRDSFNDFLAQHARTIRSRATQRGYEIKASAFEDFEDLDNAPEDAKEFGCRVDYNAYNLQPNKPECPADLIGRPAGGHLHFGTIGRSRGQDLVSDMKSAAKLTIGFDYTIGLASVALLGESVKDKELARREFYGKAGSFRMLSENHVEYRTPSGAAMPHFGWIGLFQGLGKMVINHHTYNGDAFFKRLRHILDPREVRSAIDNHDVGAAKKAWSTVMASLVELEIELHNNGSYFYQADGNNERCYHTEAIRDEGYAAKIRYMDYLPSTAAYLKDVGNLFIRATDKGYVPANGEIPTTYSGVHSTAHGDAENSLGEFLSVNGIAFEATDNYEDDDSWYEDDEDYCNCEACR